MKPDASQHYLARMGRVLDHIDAHLDADLGTEALARVAAFSPFHFHRQFAELFGISVHRYVQLARLKRASLALAYRTHSVLDIACAANRVAANHVGVAEGLIPAGRCAVIRMHGPGDNLRPAAHFLYAAWLPRSGEELRDFPMFAQRVTFFPDVPASEAVTDVFLPLA